MWVMFAWSVFGSTSAAGVALVRCRRSGALTDRGRCRSDRGRQAARVGLCRRMRVPRVRHVDIADGMVEVRGAQARPLAAVRARLARVYVTGNREYFSEAQGWLDYIYGIGWDALHNRHGGESRSGADEYRPFAAGDAARASAQAGRAGGDGRSGPANLGAHPRRADLAVQLFCQTRLAGGARTEQARRAHLALHESW